ncbi:MAG: DUF3822 family protein [Bacteroidota bacterium]
MVTPFSHTLFIEAPDYKEHLKSGKLTIFIKDQSLFYVIIGTDHKVKLCKAIHNKQQLSSSLFLRFVFEKEKVLQGWNDRSQVLSSSPKFTLLPRALSKKGKDILYAQLFLQDTIYDDEVYTQDFAKDSIRCIFLDNPQLHHVLGEYLGNYTFKHIATTNFEFGTVLSGEIPNHILLHHLGSHVVASFFKEGQFQYCNAFEYRTDSGLLYFIRSLIQLMDLQDSIPIFMVGEVDPSDSLFEYLLSHLPGFSFPHMIERYLPSMPSALPYWKFCYLLFS